MCLFFPVVLMSAGITGMFLAAWLLPEFTFWMRYPKLAAAANLAFPVCHLLILLALGQMVAVICFSRGAGTGWEYVDLIVLGLGASVVSGVIGGLFGLLSPAFYLVVCVLVAVAYLFRARHLPRVSLPRVDRLSWLVVPLVACVVVHFSFYQLVEDAIIKTNVDFHLQYLPQIRALAESGALVPSPYSLENKVHEYFYAMLVSAPCFHPRLAFAMPFFHIGLQILAVLLVYEGCRRLFNRPAAAASGLYLLAMLVAMTFVEHNFTPLKSAFRFFLLTAGGAAVYALLYIKEKRPIQLAVALVCTAMLAGTTVVGLCYAGVGAGVLLVGFVRKDLSRRAALAALLALAAGCLLPKLVNLVRAGGGVDYISATLLGLRSRLAVPGHAYGSALDIAMHDFWFGAANESHQVKFSAATLLRVVWCAGGWLVLAAGVIAGVRFRAAKTNGGVALYALATFAVLYYCTAVVIRQSILLLPWAALLLGFVAYQAGQVLELEPVRRKLPRWGPTAASWVLALGLVLPVTWPDERMARFWDSKPLVSERSRRKEAALRVQKTGEYLRSTTFAKNRKLFSSGELVIVYGNRRFPAHYIADYYGFTAVNHTNLLNAAFFCETPEKSARLLRELGIRYVLVSNRILRLPKPQLFMPQGAGRHLRVVLRGGIFPPIYPETAPEYEAEELLLEILPEAASEPDPLAGRLLLGYEFTGSEQMREALRSLSGETAAMKKVAAMAPRRFGPEAGPGVGRFRGCD